MKLVKVKNFPDRIAAELAQQRLKELGIESIIQSDSVGILGTFGGVFLRGADLYVREELVENAREILDDLSL